MNNQNIKTEEGTFLRSRGEFSVPDMVPRGGFLIILVTLTFPPLAHIFVNMKHQYSTVKLTMTFTQQSHSLSGINLFSFGPVLWCHSEGKPYI